MFSLGVASWSIHANRINTEVSTPILGKGNVHTMSLWTRMRSGKSVWRPCPGSPPNAPGPPRAGPLFEGFFSVASSTRNDEPSSSAPFTWLTALKKIQPLQFVLLMEEQNHSASKVLRTLQQHEILSRNNNFFGKHILIKFEV